MTLGGVGGETGILGKCENWGIFILRIGDRILMKLYIYIKGSYVSDAPFSTRVGSGDIGDWRRGTETLENT